ncbi:MAG: Crp/Fnr family transcriptional regulator [Sphingobium sp.]
MDRKATPNANLRILACDVFTRTGWMSRQPSELRELVLQTADLRRIRAKEFVYYQGDHPNGIFGVVSGCFMVESILQDGRRQAVSLMQEGSWFGELSTIEGGRRPSSAIATTEAVVLHIPPELFIKIIDRDPRHLMSIANLLSERVQTMSWLREELSAPDPVHRVSTILVSLTDVRERANLKLEVVIPITQDQLASFANLSRQTVNHALKHLEKLGVIECRYGAIILKPDCGANLAHTM